MDLQHMAIWKPMQFIPFTRVFSFVQDPRPSRRTNREIQIQIHIPRAQSRRAIRGAAIAVLGLRIVIVQRERGAGVDLGLADQARVRPGLEGQS